MKTMTYLSSLYFWFYVLIIFRGYKEKVKEALALTEIQRVYLYRMGFMKGSEFVLKFHSDPPRYPTFDEVKKEAYKIIEKEEGE